jgi:hypothetical protein
MLKMTFFSFCKKCATQKIGYARIVHPLNPCHMTFSQYLNLTPWPGNPTCRHSNGPTLRRTVEPWLSRGALSQSNVSVRCGGRGWTLLESNVVPHLSVCRLATEAFIEAKASTTTSPADATLYRRLEEAREYENSRPSSIASRSSKLRFPPTPCGDGFYAPPGERKDVNLGSLGLGLRV